MSTMYKIDWQSYADYIVREIESGKVALLI
jgi:hypothetical protein